MSQTPRVAIIGGGISGLAAAFYMQQSGRQLDIHLLEAAPRLGGVLFTERVDSLLVEHSADMFAVDPSAAIQLCETLGMAGDLLTTLPTPDRAFVATDDGLAPVPAGFSLLLPGDVEAVLASPLLSAAGKQRFLEEAKVPPKTDDQDESLQSFAVRRFGVEVFERLIQPLASGIYTADPATLSMQATMERFVQLEKQFGSLIVAAQHQSRDTARGSGGDQTSGARYGLFRAPLQGMGTLVTRIRQAIPDVQIRNHTTVRQLQRRDHRWVVEMVSSDSPGVTAREEFDAVIVTTSAAIAGRMLQRLDPDGVSLLGSISAASTAIVALAMDWPPGTERFEGYGILVPAVLKRPVLACSFASNKFAHRAGPQQTLIRCFLGGALNPQVLQETDPELVQLALAEIRRHTGLTGPPRLTRVIRWNQCMPQYTLGHLDRVAKIEAWVSQFPGLQLAGNSYHGVGIPACIAAAAQAANQTVTLFDG